MSRFLCFLSGVGGREGVVVSEIFDTNMTFVRPKRLWKPACRRTARTNFIIKNWVSQFVGLLRRNHLYGLILHGFSAWISARIFARIFCTDFLHGFFARIFLHGFFCTDFARICARIFARFFCADSLHESLHRILARIFCTDFLGCPKALAEKRQKSTEKIP